MKQQQLLLVSLYSLIIIIAWITFNLYNNSVTSTITQEQQTQITPIDPTFNEQTIEKLRTRENITPSYQLPVEELKLGEIQATKEAPIKSGPVVELSL